MKIATRTLRKRGFMKAVLILGACLLLISCASVYTESQKEMGKGNKWVFYGKSFNVSFYYDRTSISQQSQKIKVWTKWEKKDAAAVVKDDGRPDNYSYSLVLDEIDCINKEIRTIFSADYDNKGNPLDTQDMKKGEINPIEPYSQADLLYTAVCK